MIIQLVFVLGSVSIFMYMMTIKRGIVVTPPVFLYLIPTFLYLIEPLLAHIYGFRRDLNNEVVTLLVILAWIIAIGIGFKAAQSSLKVRSMQFDDGFLNLAFILCILLYVLYIVRVNGSFPKTLFEVRMYYIKLSSSGIAFIYTILNEK